MNDLECPYCEAWNEVCHDDGEGYEEDVDHEMQCADCGKHFTFQTHRSFSYYPNKAGCLNGGPHSFGEWQGQWTWQGKTREIRRCAGCAKTELREVRR